MAAPVSADDLYFVNRGVELAEFDALLADLTRGIRRHLALLGLRRIGKTVLMDEVRRRHPYAAIAYLALDEVVSSPEDFTRALASEILRVAVAGKGKATMVGQDDAALSEAAAAVGVGALAAATQLLALLAAQQSRGSYAALLAATLRFPAEVARALDQPVLVMLDEFQELTRLQAFPGTDNLLGALRAALDRRDPVAYVVAGSRVTVLRRLLSDGDNPIFTRFEQLELRPFTLEATGELATRIWDADAIEVDPDAVTRLQKLTGGWPFYVQSIAARGRQLARAADGRLSADLIDLAFRQELIGRAAALGQYCRYLLDAALRTDANGARNTLEAVLRQVARWQPLDRPGLERRLQRHHGHTAIHNAVNSLIDTDFLREEAGVLTPLDPVFALWLNLEPVRRDPDAALSNPPALRRLLSWYEAQRQLDRQTMGTLFERRVENLTRQFRGQDVDGNLFGVDGVIHLPLVRDAGRLRLDDPEGRYGQVPDTYELDIVTSGDRPDDRWAIEVKHRQGAMTTAMVERFLRSVEAVERAHGMTFARRWVVASRGIRREALPLLQQSGTLASGIRQIERLERICASPTVLDASSSP